MTNSTGTVIVMRVLFASLAGLAALTMIAKTAAVAGPTTLAQASDELAPYDAGFAIRASEKCPGLTMLVPLGDEAKANEQFKRGVAMFDRYLELQTMEAACKAALNLYDSKTGKAAKVLAPK
jgi:hypothetical protein